MKQLIIYCLFIFLIGFITSCSKKPRSCFDVNTTEIDVGGTVNFINCSENSSNFLWDFGDGDSLFSTKLAVDHTYEKSNAYTMSLYAYNSAGDAFDLESVVILVNGTADYFEGKYNVVDEYGIDHPDSITTTTLYYACNILKKNDEEFQISVLNGYSNVIANVIDTNDFEIPLQIVSNQSFEGNQVVKEIWGEGFRNNKNITLTYYIQEKINSVVQPQIIVGNWKANPYNN